MSTQEILRGMYCLGILTDDQIAKLAEIAQFRTYEKDSYVEKENDLAKALYIVKSGRVAIEISLPLNRRVAIYIVKPGDLFGWSAVVAPYEITASSLCTETTELIVFPKDDLLALLNSDAPLKASFMEVITHVIRYRLKDTRLQLTYLLGG